MIAMQQKIVSIESVIASSQKFSKKSDRELLRKAFDFALKKHNEAKESARMQHLLCTALEVSEMGVDDATIAYQGYGGRLPIPVIKKLNDLATGRLKPDLTILLDVDTRTGLRRAKVKGIDRMERKDIIYHRRVRAGYLKLAKENPDRIKVIRVTDSIAKIQQDVRAEVELVIQRYKMSG